MRMFLFSVFVFLVLSYACLFGADRTNYYNRSGGQVGTGTTIGRNTYYRSTSGRNVGTARQSGQHTYFYDGSGRSTGRAYGPFVPSQYFPRSK
jgi:uncharacterized membrane protein